jgi:S-DNA-T family DNA segregation ATPase FtsK/SpoIIIE
MAKTSKKEKTSKPKTKLPSFKFPKFELTNQQRLILGSLLACLGLILFVSFLSSLFTGQADQSTISEFTDKSVETKNWMSKSGAWLSYIFILKGFGVAGFLLSGLTLLSSIYIFSNAPKKRIQQQWFWGLLIMTWLSVLFGFFTRDNDILSGVIGFELNTFLQIYIGKIGTVLLLLFLFITYLAIRFKVTPQSIAALFKSAKKDITDELTEAQKDFVPLDITLSDEAEAIKQSIKNTESTLSPSIDNNLDIENNLVEETTKGTIQELESTVKPTEVSPIKSTSDFQIEIPKDEEEIIEENVEIQIEKIGEEKSETDNLANKLVADFGEFDPTLELGNYQFPPLDLLKKYDNEGVTINQEELEENKNRIVDTLNNYKIGIASIKATIGPTVTLYEIVPEAGIRISKIKNLEDDIALSLSALGIRIIAPIPGKGTIGIEVPNKNATIVSMRSVIASQKFQKTEMHLPIAIGKTISNETLIVDLAKMPHLLMAGATGQGKSVGLNAVLTSLLYKKHPAEVKFVLVDPKKVELTLFNKIERHYLAKLPDDGDAIITDNTKVIHTLNSLCIEMDNRYEMLKNALCRNIVEYNKKFKDRKLNPNDGHAYLPYIVLVVDEFADLIMTAGKEVETPVARLAQLARAIGIHLIIATQRPSVNVITGIIKANFPARIAFRVSSKIDSRTILDAGGADQLIGRGDMLYTQGNDMIRVQCAFVDTPEVEKIVNYIGDQRAYPEAYQLPEFVGEEGGINLDVDIADRDKLFRDAAEIIVTAQQGSASLLQRKLKLGYNRAGRIIDQLEAAGIVGGFEGSKARQVLVPDFIALDQLLENEKQ